MTIADVSRGSRGARVLALGALAFVWAATTAVAATAGNSAPSLLVNAIVVDLVLTSSLVFWWLGVERGGMPLLVLAPVLLVGIGLAHALVGPHDPVVLKALVPAAILIEVGLVAAVLTGVGRAAGAVGRGVDDALEDVRGRVRRVAGDGILARLLSSELTAIWYATVGWLRTVPSYDGARVLGYHRGTGAAHGALVGASLVEIVAVHLLVSQWSMLAAVGLGLVGAYGAVWILADLRATRLRPVTLDDDMLVVRTGLRWTIPIPRDCIASISKPDWRRRFGTVSGELNAAVMGTVNLVVEVSQPVEAVGPFGITRKATRIGITLDAPAELIGALELESDEPGTTAM